jgi:serine O-acetyltransferase
MKKLSFILHLTNIYKIFVNLVKKVQYKITVLKYIRDDQWRLQLYSACDIDKNIDELRVHNINFPHPVGIVISKHVAIGNNCKIYQNVTIGAKSDEEAILLKYPKIGNNVTIYAGAVIIGDISIGNNAIIGANAFINKSVHANCIMAGNPAQKIGILQKQNFDI